jgi:hypothetical protein
MRFFVALALGAIVSAAGKLKLTRPCGNADLSPSDDD